MFREKIKLAMGNRNLKTSKVSAECGINSSVLSAFLSGSRNVKYEHIDTLVSYLDLTLVPKKGFHFHSEFMEKKEEEREAKIAARQND